MVPLQMPEETTALTRLEEETEPAPVRHNDLMEKGTLVQPVKGWRRHLILGIRRFQDAFVKLLKAVLD